MSKIVWDKLGEHFYETGVDHAVYYDYDAETNAFNNGVPWNGVTAITESPSGAEPSPIYADNIKYLNLISAEDFAATIEALTYPDEFKKSDGKAEIATGVTIGQQQRKIFGLCYRSLVGSDTEAAGTAGYVIHIVYNCTASPSEKSHNTVNENPEASTMSWSLSTTPIDVEGYKPTATVEVDSRTTPAAKLAQLEAILYGSASSDPRLPFPSEIATLVGAA